MKLIPSIVILLGFLSLSFAAYTDLHSLKTRTAPIANTIESEERSFPYVNAGPSSRPVRDKSWFGRSRQPQIRCDGRLYQKVKTNEHAQKLCNSLKGNKLAPKYDGPAHMFPNKRDLRMVRINKGFFSINTLRAYYSFFREGVKQGKFDDYVVLTEFCKPLGIVRKIKEEWAMCDIKNPLHQGLPQPVPPPNSNGFPRPSPPSPPPP